MKTPLHFSEEHNHYSYRAVAALWVFILISSVVFTCVAEYFHLEDRQNILAYTIALGIAASFVISLRRA